ncbi:MAG: hypothetical protein DM484_07130 [Candidatus Methylumidiphilus alinenensis]|uniref:Uncharacterized protein n=1 Tax=Candidatus Methylumidiphilus alinenensis TaxID=2202197 RepID=A0A2W4RDA5_9GAMM|nr:MAG: hypothetical protein DM484_07130 [Candidatus Methylumidiphilus alinenensis]
MNNQLSDKAYFVLNGLLLPIVIAVLATFQIAKAEDYVCNAFEITKTAPELDAIHNKYDEAKKGSKEKEKEKLKNQFFEKLESKVREKCQQGDVIFFGSANINLEHYGEMAELLCDYNKTITGDGASGSCVLAPHRGIRPLQ